MDLLRLKSNAMIHRPEGVSLSSRNETFCDKKRVLMNDQLTIAEWLPALDIEISTRPKCESASSQTTTFRFASQSCLTTVGTLKSNVAIFCSIFFFRQQSSPEEPLQSQVKRQRSIIREVLLLFLCRSSACLSPLMVDTITAVNLWDQLSSFVSSQWTCVPSSCVWAHTRNRCFRAV